MPLNGRFVGTLHAGSHQWLLLLHEVLAADAKLLRLRVQATTGGAGASCDRPPAHSRLPDISALLNKRMGRERGQHRQPS